MTTVVVARYPGHSMEQLSLSFETGISRKHRTLQRCCSAWVYRLGFNDVAIDIDQSPGNLSNMLSEEKTRKFGVDDLEEVLDQYKDFEPIFYLIDKYLKNNKTVSNANLINQAASLMGQFQDVMDQMKEGSGA